MSITLCNSNLDLIWKNITKNPILYDELCANIKKRKNTFGTSIPSNRFSIGMSYEKCFVRFFKECGMKITHTGEKKRIDILFHFENDSSTGLSIKYSSSGSIKIHNSLGLNKDVKFHPTLLIASNENLLLLIDEKIALDYGVDISNFLKNVKDGLQLNRKIINVLKATNYPFIKTMDLGNDKCENISVVDTFEYICEKYPQIVEEAINNSRRTVTQN